MLREYLLDRRLGGAGALRNARYYVRTLTTASIRAEWLSLTLISRIAAGNAEADAALLSFAGRRDDHNPIAHLYYLGAFDCLGGPTTLPTSDVQE